MIISSTFSLVFCSEELGGKTTTKCEDERRPTLPPSLDKIYRCFGCDVFVFFVGGKFRMIYVRSVVCFVAEFVMPMYLSNNVVRFLQLFY